MSRHSCHSSSAHHLRSRPDLPGAGPGGGIVQTYDVCDGTPAELLMSELCLDELSKDVRGDLHLLEARRHECREDDCLTLTVEHLLRLELTSHACDSALGALLTGRLQSKDLCRSLPPAAGTVAECIRGRSCGSRQRPGFMDVCPA